MLGSESRCRLEVGSANDGGISADEEGGTAAVERTTRCDGDVGSRADESPFPSQRLFMVSVEGIVEAMAMGNAYRVHWDKRY